MVEVRFPIVSRVWMTTTQDMSKPRFLREDMDLGGARLKRGDQIMAMLMAANMDPAANEAPEKLDLERRPNTTWPLAQASISVSAISSRA